MDRRGNCARIVAAAQLEAGVRSVLPEERVVCVNPDPNPCQEQTDKEDFTRDMFSVE